jgi:hypothetical protein
VSPGDEVIYLADPALYWIGTIEAVLADGRLLVTFPGDSSAVFDATELELHSVWAAKTAA